MPDGKVFLPFASDESGIAPLLFVNDDDGVMQDENSISMKEVLQEEKEHFPTANVGYWAGGLKIKPGVVPEVTPLEHYSLEMETQGKDGQKHTVNVSTDRYQSLN